MDQRILQIIQKHPELKSEFEEIYPELKESEDERIRKFLINLVNDGFTCFPDGLMRRDVLAYLKKQKTLSELDKYIVTERTKPGFMFNGNDSVSWEELPLSVRKDDYPYYFIGNLDCYPFIVEQKPEVKYVYPKFRVGDEIVEVTPNGYCPPVVVKCIEKGSYICESKDGKRFLSLPIKKENEYRLVDQIPADWSKEDDAAHTRTIGVLAKAFRGILPTKPSQEDIEWFKSLPKRFNLQPKQEWNEEDEKIWQDIFELCNRFGYDDACRKLKSLRPSWKPSKEQINSLQEVIILLVNLRRNVGDRKNLELLYEQLKELM